MSVKSFVLRPGFGQRAGARQRANRIRPRILKTSLGIGPARAVRRLKCRSHTGHRVPAVRAVADQSPKTDRAAVPTDRHAHRVSVEDDPIIPPVAQLDRDAARRAVTAECAGAVVVFRSRPTNERCAQKRAIIHQFKLPGSFFFGGRCLRRFFHFISRMGSGPIDDGHKSNSRSTTTKAIEHLKQSLKNESG